MIAKSSVSGFYFFSRNLEVVQTYEIQRLWPSYLFGKVHVTRPTISLKLKAVGRNKNEQTIPGG